MLDIVHNICNTIPEKFKDFIIKPKDNGYQSLHIVIIVGSPGRNMELQIRSKQMHDRAELGEANHLKYKNAQEDQIKTLFDGVTLRNAYNILNQFNWTESKLIAYEQEIHNVWWYYQADLASMQQQFVD